MSLPPPPDSHAEAGPISDSTARLESLIAALQTQIIQQQTAIAALQARNAELERQLGLNSGNRGKPPSSDGLKKKPSRVRSLHERASKKPGGQKGQPGKTLSRSETPDATIDHFPETCSGCGSALTGATATGHTARQVFDLPEPQPLIVTEHRAHASLCGNCGTETHGLSRRGDRAGPVRCAPRGGGGVSVALSVAARKAPRRADGRSVRRAPGIGHHRWHEP
jgi:transposase